MIVITLVTRRVSPLFKLELMITCLLFTVTCLLVGYSLLVFTWFNIRYISLL